VDTTIPTRKVKTVAEAKLCNNHIDGHQCRNNGAVFVDIGQDLIAWICRECNAKRARRKGLPLHLFQNKFRDTTLELHA
jgi:hypothetical protein